MDCECVGVLTVRHLLNFRFGNTCDVSFICLMRPTDAGQKLKPLHTNEVMDVRWMDVDQFIDNEKHLFFGKEKENLDLLRRASQWMATHWQDLQSEEAVESNVCIQKFKQTHPFNKKTIIDLYHR